MARTAEMRLIELMVLKQDISAVIEYIGKKETFQFQKDFNEGSHEKKSDSVFDVDSKQIKIMKIQIDDKTSDNNIGNILTK